MNSKVIKWLKRQTSIRRLSDKGEEKKSTSNHTEDKRKISFPRLSFKRRIKQSTKNHNGTDKYLPTVSISKRLSHSVPKEIESDSRRKNNGPINDSLSFESSSVSSYPAKADRFRSSSELSYHSSYEYNKSIDESSRDIKSDSNPTELRERKEEISAIKYPISGSRHTFHNLNDALNSINDDSSYLSQSDHNIGIENRTKNAPLVKMEEICDINNDKEHPEDKHISNPVSEFVTNKGDCDLRTHEKSITVENERDCGGDSVDCRLSHTSSLTADHEDDMEGSLTDVLEIEVNNCNNESEFDSKVEELFSDSDNSDENEIEDNETTTENRDTLNDTLENKTEVPIQNSTKKTKEIIYANCVYVTSENAIITTCDDKVITKSNKTLNDQNNSDDRVNNTYITDNVLVKPSESEENVIGVEAENSLSESDSSEEFHTIIETVSIESNHSGDLKENESFTEKQMPIDNTLTVSEGDQFPLEDNKEDIEIIVTQPSPIKSKPVIETKICENNYPEELNPFEGEESNMNEDYISVQEENEIVNQSKKKTLKRENENIVFNNNFNNYNDHDGLYKRSGENGNEIHHSPAGQLPSQCHTGKGPKSNNPFGESDDDDDVPINPLNSTNPFDEDDHSPSLLRKSTETPPRLPSKSTDLQTRNLNRGTLIPVPRPRKSKQSLHGSYTSLQNVSLCPVPAPRSITPFGSTKTLNESASTNPFDDDNDEEQNSIERRSLERCSLRMGASTSALEPMTRSGVRGSLPLSSKYRRKNRPAPLPPAVSNSKPPISPFQRTNFDSIPRKRSSTSPASGFQKLDRKLPNGREHSPYRTVPPRPPPPKVHYT